LAATIAKVDANAKCEMNNGFSPRSGAFEIVANGKLLHSKLNTSKFPSADEFVALVKKFRDDESQFPAAPVVDRTSSGCNAF
jgi:hypothetical protein